MKRTALLRRTPLRRSPMVRKPRRPKPGDDRPYLARVRLLPCRARGLGTPCNGRVESHHAGKRPGTGMKAPDDTAIPLCHQHHVVEWHGATGAFRGWGDKKRRSWSDEQIAAVREELAPPFDEQQDRLDEAMERSTVRL